MARYAVAVNQPAGRTVVEVNEAVPYQFKEEITYGSVDVHDHQVRLIA